MGPVFIGGGGGPFRRPFYGPTPGARFGSGGCGCLVLPIIVIVIMVVGALLIFSGPSYYEDSASSSGQSTEITKSTVEREALPKGSVNETAYYTDELGWIRNPSKLTPGMQNFYNKTGVQPYLYLTDTIDGTHTPTEAQAEDFAYDIYDALFTDEAHFLLIFFEYNDTYHTWYLTGTQANSVMDQEATDILLDYVDRYYYDQSLTDEEIFSKAFNDAGDRIMKVETNPWIPVIVVLGVLGILVVIVLFWRQRKKQQNLEAEQTKEILQTPLQTYGSTEADELAKKYDDKE